MMVLHVKLCKRMYDSISGGWCEDNNAVLVLKMMVGGLKVRNHQGICSGRPQGT